MTLNSGVILSWVVLYCNKKQLREQTKKALNHDPQEKMFKYHSHEMILSHFVYSIQYETCLRKLTVKLGVLTGSLFCSLSTRFGTVAVPNILLFQGAKPMARFNHTDRTLETLKVFIFNQTGE